MAGEGAAVSSSNKVILIAIGVFGLLFTLPTVFLIVVGMIPTFAAFLVDRRREKYTTLCVGAMNFVGVLPFAIKLWSEDHSYDMAFSLLADPFVWLTMLGAAALGWAIFMVAPGIVGMFYGMRVEQRIERLQKRQKDLVEEWGPGVAGNDAAQQESAAASGDGDGEEEEE